MRQVILLLFCASTLINKCYAQSNYQRGYVVDLKGDTVRGFIEYERWDRNPRRISFKPTLGSTGQIYYPTDIRSFFVGGEIYEGGVVDVDTSPVKLRDLDQSPLPSYVKDSVFLQSLVVGEKSLLFLKDQTGKIHFFIKENGGYPPLLYKQYAGRTETSSKVVVENTGFKGMLALYLNSCSDIQQKLKNIGYTQAALTKLFSYYYECTKGNIGYAKQRSDGALEAGVVAGVAMTKLDFQGPVKYLTDINYEVSTKPTIGVFFDVKLLRTKGWRISNYFLFSSFDAKGIGDFEDFPDYTAYSSFKYSYIKSHHTFQISLLGQGKVYLSAGFSAGVAIKKDVEIALVYTTGTISQKEFQSRNYEFGYLAGLGFRTGKWSAEARFEQTTGISNYLSEGSTLIRGNFFIGYTVFSNDKRDQDSTQR
jgi:hypothetical protein